MQLHRFNSRILCAVLVFVFSAISWQFIGCSQNKAEKKGAIIATGKAGEAKSTTAIIAEEKDNWTDTVVGSLYVRIHNRITTNGVPSPSDPLVWDGPVEIGTAPDFFSCKIDTLWIIESLEAGFSSNQLRIKSYSGSNNRIDLIDVDSCKIINTRIY
jgi:hypothetical protein